MKDKWLPVLATTGRILTFRATRTDFDSLNEFHLILGLVFTWLVGLGRSWDHVHGGIARHLGIGSLIYVFGLALFLWLLILPICRFRSYWHVLTFVTLTSPPGLFYAIPVEKFLAVTVAANVNLTFLVIVATWRVALWFSYLRVGHGLSWKEVAVIALLPLSTIVAVLTPFSALALMVMSAMAGIYDPKESQSERTMTIVLIAIAVISVVAFPFLVKAYSRICKHAREEQSSE